MKTALNPYLICNEVALKKALLVDFEDSFTWNIACELEKMDVTCEIIHFRDFVKMARENLEGLEKNIILGPGPGHPDEYSEVIEVINWLLSAHLFNILGICLGHQLIWRAKGADIVQLKNPVHGCAREFMIPDWNLFDKEWRGRAIDVQLYNSLAVDISKLNLGPDEELSVQSGVLMSGKGKGFLTYQFHPESIGTSCPTPLFAPFCLACYNDRDEAESSSGRRLRYTDTQFFT